MAQNDTALPSTSVVTKLRQLYEEKSTGILIIRGSMGQMARVHMTDGKIVALFIQNKQGYDAMALLAAFQARRIDFISGVPSSVNTPLPPTEAFLAILAAEPAPPPNISPASHATSGQPLTAALRTLLEETLGQYIGPMAGILCETVLHESHDVASAISALAAHLPDAPRAQRFVTAMQARVAAQV